MYNLLNVLNITLLQANCFYENIKSSSEQTKTRLWYLEMLEKFSCFQLTIFFFFSDPKNTDCFD